MGIVATKNILQYWLGRKDTNWGAENLKADFFIEYLTQNVIFHVKSHVTKHPM